MTKNDSPIPSSELYMFFHQFAVWLLVFNVWGGSLLAQATLYPPPLSFSGANLIGKDFSGQQLRQAEFSTANLRGTNFSGADLRGVVFSTSVMTGVNLQGADLTNAFVDGVNLEGANLKDAVFVEALLLRSVLKDADITGADFTDALLDGTQVRQLCDRASGSNSKTGVATRDSLFCP